MNRMHNPRLTLASRELRHNMTPQERRLWYNFLSGHAARFRRQAVLGRFIVDFYSPSAKLVIEVDGSQHYSPEGAQYDRDRSAFLAEYGLTVVRFSNREIDCEFRAVCEKIEQILSTRR